MAGGYDRRRDWTVTVYPLKYEDATSDEICSKEYEWLQTPDGPEGGPFHFDSSQCVYFYGCMEKNLEKGSGKLHCHYRIYFDYPVRITSIQALFGKNMHCQPCKKPDKYEQYVRKEGKYAKKAHTHVSGPFIFGHRPHQGRWKAWDDVRDMVKEGYSNREIVDQHGFMAVHAKGLAFLRQLYAPAPGYPFVTPRPYQDEVFDLLREPPVERRWIWVWSAEYGVGKTNLGSAIKFRHPNAIFGSLDPRSVLMQYIQGVTDVVIFDLPRGTRIRSALLNQFEDLSDFKWVCSDKFEVYSKYVHSHLVIISNEDPKKERFKLYSDRIKEIHAS